jgi:glycosyltransferase involved in cell wall biosynthesis
MRILYLYPRPVADDIQQVNAGEAPSDRLYGLVELRRYGHHVDVADSRFEGRAGRLVRHLRGRGIHISDFATFERLRDYDVVVVKDNFSTALSLVGRGLGARIVYVDAMFQLPRRAIKHGLNRLNLALASGVVSYSRTQIAHWANRYGLADTRFTFLPYAIDTAFYTPVTAPSVGRPYVLSVGRDQGRSFRALAEAMTGLDLDLKLVTLPYLLGGVPRDTPQVEILSHVSYAQLFSLYAGASLVVVPLKAGLTYPSGIRGLLEAMALERPTIATRTPVLEEYAREGEGVSYVEADDVQGMHEAIARLTRDEAAGRAIATRGAEIVRERYHMDIFARGLESLLFEVANGRRVDASASSAL